MSSLTLHQSKALNIDKSISLTANAGSGKTFVLAQRYLEIILNTSTPLSKVAAITFTEKAAGELYKRIAEELTRLLLSSTDSNLKLRIEKIRKQLVSAKISTIHSFCIDLLKEFPVEASIDANFIPINEQKTSELIDLCIESSLREMFKDPEKQSDIKLLIRLLGSKINLVKELSELISKRKNVLYLLENFYSLSESEIVKHFFKLFKSHLKIVLEKDIPSVLSHLEIINQKVLKNYSTNELALEVKKMLDELMRTNDELEVLLKINELRTKVVTNDGSVRKRLYLSSPLRDEIQNSVGIVESFFSDLDEIEFGENHEIIENELAKYGLALIHVLQNVLTAFENKKSEIGVLDFEDILLKTKKLLDIASVKKSLSSKYKFLLVDEYQDTNEIQYEIFLPLVDDLKTGNLFIVGDEKQSIYRFRDAELQVFTKTKTDIQESNGDDSLLTLPDSFRMAPAICFFVNSLFKVLFREPRYFFNEVASSDLICARSDVFQGRIEFLIASGDEKNEAELVARRIIKLRFEYKDRLPDWKNIAVLVRKRASFIELQKAFIKYQIPFNLVGGTGFYQQQSISDIYNYFAFLFNDKDDGALIGILRSPFFMMSDKNIFHLSLFNGETYWEKLKTAAGARKEYWGKIFRLIDENRQLANKTNIPLLLRKILKESDFISTISARVNGVQEISNLNKLLSLTIEFFNKEFNTMYDYVSFLNNAISKTENEAQAGIVPGSNRVNILTIHQAKGLEYPVVFLYKCNDITQVNKVKARSFTVDKSFGLLTKVPINENYFGNYHSAPIVGLYNFIESRKETAELKRLLYVGLTRAIDFLFITQTDEGKSINKNSFAGLISEGLNPDFTKDSFKLDGGLTFLQKENDDYPNITKPTKLEIPIIRDIQSSEVLIEEKGFDIQNKQMLLSEIKDHSRGEVISATRFSTFSSCPFKYNLLYNYKLGDLVLQSRKFIASSKFNIQEDYNKNELNSYLLDDESNREDFSRFKGKVIHYALRKNINEENVRQFVENHMKNSFNGEIPELLQEEIINVFLLFYGSSEYQFINSFPAYKNEFEVYLKEDDYYLFGILDKLIIEDKKLIIVDYKTDNIEADELKMKAEKYLPQLKFYSYIITRLFNNKKAVEGRVIFIKYPQNPFIFNNDEISDENLKPSVKAMIRSIRNNNYSLNLSHCKDCIFADENSQCIKTSAEINSVKSYS
jgi:ATP-dependent helicase/nuclease subunit A